MAGLPPPPPASGPTARERAPAGLSPEDDAARRRVRWLLLLVPFTFPLWLRLRREHPAAARAMRFEFGVCVFNSVAVVLLACCMVSLAMFRSQIVEALTKVVLDLRLVR